MKATYIYKITPIRSGLAGGMRPLDGMQSAPILCILKGYSRRGGLSLLALPRAFFQIAIFLRPSHWTTCENDPSAARLLADKPQVENAYWALLLGALATVALPLGAVVGVAAKPSHRVAGGLAGFGAGALFAALSIDLVAPTMLKGVESAGSAEPLVLLIGSAVGGLVFVLLDHLLNLQGGYLRKTATAILYLSHRRAKRMRALMEKFARSAFFRSLPPDQIHLLVDRLHETSVGAGETLFYEGEVGDRLFMLEDGQIELTRAGTLIGTLGAGEILGEIALITGATRTATATAKQKVHLLELTGRDFERVCRQAPEVAAAVKELAGRRLEELGRREAAQPSESTRWASIAGRALRHRHRVPSPTELRKEAESHSNAPLAIWLGALMDGVPESFVLGTSYFAMLTAGGSAALSNPLGAVPMTLLAGLFLSNFPEAMSSSVGMAAQGWSRWRIMLLWGSLTVVTSFLTMGGFIFGEDVSHLVEVGAEGLAAGAMLTMIAQTMIPEAVHLGGANIVGLSTLAGFLTTVAFKLVEG